MPVADMSMNYPADPQPKAQSTPVLVALAALMAVSAAGFLFGGNRQGLAVFIGGLAGFALYHASFGFTAAWRRVFSERRVGGCVTSFS